MYDSIRVVVTRDSDQRTLKQMSDAFERMTPTQKKNAPVVVAKEEN